MAKVLKGIRIVEQGTFITGPCAAMVLADLGADVIKIESPKTGDPYRNFNNELYSAHFQAYNRNKRSLTLDMKDPDGREVFQDLISTADVYIQNFRPGAAERLGAGWEDLSRTNAALVYASISGFGADGPYVARPSYDSVTQALSGFLGVAIDPENPRLLGPALADAITGLYAAMGIMGALIERGRTGKGRLLEISMLEAMMHFSIEPFTGFLALNALPDGLDRPRLAQAYIVRCADGGLIALHLSSLDKFWDALVEAIDGAALKADPRFAVRLARIDNYPALAAALNEIFARQPRQAWLARLAGFDLPHAPVNSIDEAINDPQVQHLNMLVPVTNRSEGAHEAVRPPFNFDGVRDQSVRAAPLVGEHTGEILHRLKASPGQWPGEEVPPAPVRARVQA